MENLKQQLEEINEAAYLWEHNKSFFFQSCLEEIEKNGYQFESTKEIVVLSKKVYNF